MKTVVYLSIIIYLLLFLTYTFFSQKEKHEKEKQDDTKNTNKNENNKILIHIAWFITGFSIFLLALSNIQYPDLHIGEFTVKLLGLYGFLAFIVFLLYGLTTMTTSQSFYIHKLVSSGFTISFYGILLLGGIGLLSNILNNKQTNILDTIPILKNVMRYLKNQWNITTNTSWVILGLEAILLIGYFTLPALIKRIYWFHKKHHCI
jgi:Ca2+/Na+ antiporter